MQEQIDEKISLLLDDELGREQAYGVLRQIQGDPDLEQSFQRYHIISQVLKHDSCSVLPRQFATQIQQQIRQEPSYLLPVKTRRKHFFNTSLAIAASLLIFVMFTLLNQQQTQISNPQPQLAEAIHTPANQLQPLSPRLTEYLQAHDNAVYTNNVVRIQPYTHVVGYEQE